MPQAILVTGSTGLLGNNVIRVLLDRGFAVRAMVRPSSDLTCFQGLDVELAYGDLTSQRDVQNCCRDMDGVVHCGGVVAVGWSPEPHQQINVEGTRNVVESAVAGGLRMVHVSSVNSLSFGRQPVVAQEDTPFTGQEVMCNYVVSKRAADRIVESALGPNFRPVIVYPGLMFGPWDWKPSSGRMLVEVAAGNGLIAPPGGCSVCDVRDVARAIVNCLGDPPQQRFILAGYNIPYLELWREMARITDCRNPLFTYGPLAARLAGFATDALGRIRDREFLFNSAAIQMARRFHYYSSVRAEELLGYQVRPWKDSLNDAWEWICIHCQKTS